MVGSGGRRGDKNGSTVRCSRRGSDTDADSPALAFGAGDGAADALAAALAIWYQFALAWAVVHHGAGGARGFSWSAGLSAALETRFRFRGCAGVGGVAGFASESLRLVWLSGSSREESEDVEETLPSRVQAAAADSLYEHD